MNLRRKTKVINLIGAPCSGKSLCAGLIYAQLKMRRYITEFVQEYPKMLVWREDYETLRNQALVSKRQYEMLKCVDGKVDYIVTDGSLLLGLYYNREYNSEDDVECERVRQQILKDLDEFDNIYIFLERGDYPYETVGRVHNSVESEKIHHRLGEIMDELGLTYLTVKSDKANVDAMIAYVTQHVSIESRRMSSSIK
jgi:hypothetical protein